MVDDQSPIRRILQTVLETLGYRVLAAEGGEDALRQVEPIEGRLDLLLTDVSMPGMDGPELAHRLAAVRPEVPVLFISGDRCFRRPSRPPPPGFSGSCPSRSRRPSSARGPRRAQRLSRAAGLKRA